jgi:hypothetical protein
MHSQYQHAQHETVRSVYVRSAICRAVDLLCGYDVFITLTFIRARTQRTVLQAVPMSCTTRTHQLLSAVHEVLCRKLNEWQLYRYAPQHSSE